MAKAKIKTTVNDGDVLAFLQGVAHEQKRADSLAVLELMREVTGQEAKMWGDSIIGFDRYKYKYDSGHGGEFFKVGFSPRKQNLTLYIMPGFERYPELMAQLGKYKTGRSCLYLNKLSDINLDVLKELVRESMVYMNAKYG